MHTVCETHSFRRAADHVGMSDAEIEALVNFVSANPVAGDEISGTGGCRKFRVAGRGKGKSGGYRTITFFSGKDTPVFLITVFSKGERSNLTKGECNQLRIISRALVDEYRSRIRVIGRQA
jgi:hypothetical protein